MSEIKAIDKLHRRHVKSRTLESLLCEFASKQHGITTEENDALIIEYANEIRELLGDDAS